MDCSEIWYKYSWSSAVLCVNCLLPNAKLTRLTCKHYIWWYEVWRYSFLILHRWVVVCNRYISVWKRWMWTCGVTGVTASPRHVSAGEPVQLLFRRVRRITPRPSPSHHPSRPSSSPFLTLSWPCADSLFLPFSPLLRSALTNLCHHPLFIYQGALIVLTSS